MTKDEANNLLDELIQAAYEYDISHGVRKERLRVVRQRLTETLTDPARVPRPPLPTTDHDKKVADDWYTWGFQAGMDSSKKIAAAS